MKKFSIDFWIKKTTIARSLERWLAKPFFNRTITHHIERNFFPPASNG